VGRRLHVLLDVVGDRVRRVRCRCVLASDRRLESRAHHAVPCAPRSSCGSGLRRQPSTWPATTATKTRSCPRQFQRRTRSKPSLSQRHHRMDRRMRTPLTRLTRELLMWTLRARGPVVRHWCIMVTCPHRLRPCEIPDQHGRSCGIVPLTVFRGRCKSHYRQRVVGFGCVRSNSRFELNTRVFPAGGWPQGGFACADFRGSVLL
jgi:hypothetical protein